MDLTCHMQPPMSDEALSAVLDKTASVEVYAHLRQCPSCARRLRMLRRFESVLNQLVRFDCPSPDALSDYSAGFLGDAAEREVHRHIDICPHCRNELQTLTAFLGDNAFAQADDTIGASPNIIRVPHNVWHAHRIERNDLAAARGFDDPKIHDFAANTATVYLETRQTGAEITVSGQVVDTKIDWRNAVTEVRQSGAVMRVTRLDDICQFQFQVTPSLPIDLYITTLDGKILAIEQLDVKL